MNLDDLAAVGLYRPDAPDAQEQRVLLLRAVEAGAELDDIRQAVAEGWLHALPLRMMLLGTESRMTFGEAADAAGVDREFADRIWSALTLPRRGGRECSADDTAIFSLWAQVRDVLGEEVALRGARTHGVAMAMLADAEVTDVRSILEAPLRAAGDDNVDVSDMLSATIDAVLGPLQAMLARIHLHHLMAAARRYTLWGIAPSVDSTGELVVGFADMVGFTALGNQLEASQTDAVLRAFEARAAHTTTGDTTRLVKLIGDEAMFVAGSVDDALAVARALMTDPELPPLRIGLASGTVVVRGGDVFGSTVNLAARLVAIALPGEILVDATTAERLSDPSIAATGGPRDLPGFPDPVEVCSVRVPISPAGA